MTEPSEITRADGLTDTEGIVMDALCQAFNTFATLERQHPDELRDFADGIHRCQDALALRIVRRTFPAGWPTKPTDEHQAVKVINLPIRATGADLRGALAELAARFA